MVVCHKVGRHLTTGTKYSKYPKISYTKIADKMAYANSADSNQTAPKGELEMCQ